MPTGFQIYVDQSILVQQQQPQAISRNQPMQPALQQQQQQQQIKASDVKIARYIKDNLESKNQMFYVDERKIYPADGGEYSLEELNLARWTKVRSHHELKNRFHQIEAENYDLKQKLQMCENQMRQLSSTLKQYQQQLTLLQQQQALPMAQQAAAPFSRALNQHSPPNNRLSIVPQSLQANIDPDTSCYGNEGASGFFDAFRNTIRLPEGHDSASPLHDMSKHNLQSAQLTFPIDNTQFIRDNATTSTPENKADKAKRPIHRRMSRPSTGGSPTMKLSPITETSRDCNSKSSSSSSATSSTPGTTKKPLLMVHNFTDVPDRPLNPGDPTTYVQLLKTLAEPLERRSGFVSLNECMPTIENCNCFGTEVDNYLIDKELSKEAKMYTAQLLADDSDLQTKTICFRVDQPANPWLFYICNELHRRLVRQKMKPDIELAVMNADPAFFYSDGSILVDEYFRYVPLLEYFATCSKVNKPFPKSVAAFFTLELIQLVRVMHKCDIVHMNLNPSNIIITGSPTREDIANIDEQVSVIKLIGLDYGIDMRLFPKDFKYTSQLEVEIDSFETKPWKLDWYCVLDCIHRMFFAEDMKPVKVGGKWQVEKQFVGCPTNVWFAIFDELLNMENLQTIDEILDNVTDQLGTWLKANINFVLKEAADLDLTLEDYANAVD